MFDDLRRIADALERIAVAMERDSATHAPDDNDSTCAAPVSGGATFELLDVKYIHRLPDVVPRGW